MCVGMHVYIYTYTFTYIFVYVDDVLIMDKDPKSYMTHLQHKYIVREDTIKDLDFYLGTNVQRVDTGRTTCWGLSSDKYVKESISNVKKQLNSDGYQFHKKLSAAGNADQPYSSLKYRPEIDTSAYCSDDQVAYFQNLIGVLRWIIELGR